MSAHCSLAAQVRITRSSFPLPSAFHAPAAGGGGASAHFLRQRAKSDKLERAKQQKVFAPQFGAAPPEFAALARRCLDGNPFLRPAFAADIIPQLEALLQEHSRAAAAAAAPPLSSSGA